ncbi:MAG: T9SS type A sorting domain-containing protein, partial [Bacteroidales bacterium]
YYFSSGVIRACFGYKFRVRATCGSGVSAIYSVYSNENEINLPHYVSGGQMVACRMSELPSVSEELASQLTLYPNPTASTLYLNLNALTDEAVKVQVYNLNGQVIDRFTWEVFEGENIKEYATENLSNGIYIIMLQGKDFGIQKQKFSVIH